jgi:hypothetical protein
VDDLYFHDIDMIFYLNPIPRVSGSLGITGSTAHANYRLECGFATVTFIHKQDNQPHVNNDILESDPIPKQLQWHYHFCNFRFVCKLLSPGDI